MDIVVTIPKDEYKNDELETKEMSENGYSMFWSLAKRPKKLEVGDRIYFSKYGIIESSMTVFDIKENHTTTCETTGRNWTAPYQLFLNDLQDETHLQIPARGFQGFRYRWWENNAQ